MKLLSRFWYIIIIAILAVIVVLQQNCINNKIDEILASIAREKIMQKETAKQTEIAAYYKKKNKKVDEDIATKNQTIDEQNVQINVWHKSSVIAESKIKQLKTCPEQLTGMTDLFHGSQKFILNFTTVTFKAVDDLNFAWQSKVKIKDSEIREANASWSDVTSKLGDCTKALVIAQQKAKRRTNLGFYAGYDFFGKRFSTGIGITIDIIRLPKFLGGIL